MGMGPWEFLGVLDDAIAAAPRFGRKPILELRVPRVRLDAQEWPGKYLGKDDDGTSPVYGYTRRQCEQMREAIAAAARADVSSPGTDVTGGDYTGDLQ